MPVRLLRRQPRPSNFQPPRLVSHPDSTASSGTLATEEVTDSDAAHYYNVMFTHAHKNRRVYTEGYFHFSPKHKSSLYNLSGKKLGESFTVEKQDEPKKRISLVQVGEVVILEQWAVEILEEIDQAEFTRNLEVPCMSKQKIKKSMQNLPTIATSDNIGFTLLSRMGWSAGKGLGKDESGMVEPLGISIRDCTTGLGFSGSVASVNKNKKKNNKKRRL
jgi:hypothetical protein